MIPFRDVIVRVPKAYNSELKINGDVTIYLHDGLKQVKDTIRYGEVVAIPEGLTLDIKVGDTIFFHHGIVGVTIMETNNIESVYLIDRKENLYRVPVDDNWPMIYATVRNGEFKALKGVVFVRPIKTKKIESELLYIPNSEVEVKHIGEIVYSSNDLIKVGDKVIFDKDSEYKFKIGDEVLYRMFDKWILGILNEG